MSLAERKAMAIPIVDHGEDDDGKFTKSSCKTLASSHRKAMMYVATTLFFSVIMLFPLLSRSSLQPSADPRVLLESCEALEGLGSLFRPGRRAMPELLVAHLTETTTAEDLRFFLRSLHRSGTPARADVVLLFPRKASSRKFREIIDEEDRYFRKLLGSKAGEELAVSVFRSQDYVRPMPDFPEQASVWGRNSKRTTGDRIEGVESPEGVESGDGGEDLVHFGAVVGFDMQELDPDDGLTGFMDSSPSVLRRWLCYPILLGVVRHRYRHVMLTEVAGVFFLNDALGTLKRRDTSLHLFSTTESSSDLMENLYGNAGKDVEIDTGVISAGVIVGGTRQVRTLAAAMGTEIVRVALLRKSRKPFGEDALILTYLVYKSSALGKKVASHLQVHGSNASSVNLLHGFHGSRGSQVISDVFRRRDHRRFAVLQGLKSDGVLTERIVSLLRHDWCRSRSVELAVYEDCFVR